MKTYLVKIFLKILRGGKCNGYHEGKDRYQTVAYLSNHIIQPISKKLVDKLRYFNDVKLTKEAKLRLKWIEYYEKVKDVTKTCRYFGISRTTFYKWLKRYQKDGLRGLLDRPKTPLRKRAPTVRKKYELDIIEA